MEDLDRTGQVMDSLASAGVQFSIDDFGTGFSSLRYLAHLPLDILKIDRSFVSIIDTDERQRSIIEALVQMGRALGLLVIAEGAERPAQIGWLRHLGCEGVQGYVYGRPAPGCTAVEWISAAR